ncbi:hypothetical protein DPEC_G00083750 [Dallia pectoralis]|uniref:Uncharacterized protein n=1 Tax=Dallia pectoralis TaxID=75939 RepID=A0ACC2GZ32_DALPE|nr:hypothetical protein DPEC_G00083750 [Dallia pectoralis]
MVARSKENPERRRMAAYMTPTEAQMTVCPVGTLHHVEVNNAREVWRSAACRDQSSPRRRGLSETWLGPVWSSERCCATLAPGARLSDTPSSAGGRDCHGAKPPRVSSDPFSMQGQCGRSHVLEDPPDKGRGWSWRAKRLAK